MLIRHSRPAAARPASALPAAALPAAALPVTARRVRSLPRSRHLLAAGIAVALLAGCGSDPAADLAQSVAVTSGQAAGNAQSGPTPDVGSADGTDLCALAPREVLSRIAADFDAGTPDADLRGDNSTCVFASVAKPDVVVRFGLREGISDPITFLEPKPLSTDSRRFVPELGDTAYYDPRVGELSIAMDSRIATVFVSYGNGQTESEPTFGELGFAVAAGLGWVPPAAPSVDPCSLAAPAEIADLIGDLGDGEVRRANSEFGPGAECRMISASMAQTESVRIAVVDGVDPAAATAALARLRPVPELGESAYADGATVLLLDGSRVVRIDVNRNAMVSADGAVAVGRIVAGHLGLSAPDSAEPQTTDDADPLESSGTEAPVAEVPVAEPPAGAAEPSAVEPGAGDGICSLVPADLLAELAYDLQDGVESMGRAVAYDEQVCTWTSTSQAVRLEVGVANAVDAAAVRSGMERSGQLKIDGLGELAYYDQARGRMKILVGNTQVQVQIASTDEVQDAVHQVSSAVLAALGL